MRMTRRILYYPAITLIALTLTLAVIMVFSTYRNQHKGREQMEKSLALEASALLDLFEQVTCSGMGCAMHEARMFQQLAEAIASNNDVAYVAMFDRAGTVLAHTQAGQVGTRVNGQIPAPGEVIRLRNDTPTAHVLEIRRELHPLDEGPDETRFVALGLRMTALEEIHSADHRHNVMMLAILILLGTASVFFILVVQNFYLVQRHLDRMKSYIHYVIESMANGLISLDAKGTITTMNPVAAEIVGTPEGDAEGKSFETLFAEQAEGIRRVLQGDEALLTQEYTHQRPDGTAVPISMSATQVRDHNQQSLGAVIVLHDLREVRELQERARRAEHLASIGRMAATVAHEIRNPLSAIRGFAEYFAGLFKKEQEEREYAEVMVAESDRLNRVVSQLLDYARPIELSLSEVDLRELFDDVVRIVLPETEEQGIQLVQDIHEAISTVRMDRDRMFQVVLNLAQNSIAAMPEGGQLVLRATPAEDSSEVRLVVQDTGTGIPEGDIPQLFEPFFTTKTRGSGLGLAVVRKIVDVHNGKIHIESVVDEGTVIVLVLSHSAASEQGC